jgi:hypothetical protein
MGSPDWTAALKRPLGPADSLESAPTGSPGSMRAARETSGRRAGSLDWLTAPGRLSRQAESPGSAPARPRRGGAARSALPQTKPAASCDRTQHKRDAPHARPKRFTMHINVTNLSPRGIFRPLRRLAQKCKGRPEGRPFTSAETLRGFHSMPGESRLLRPRRKPAKPRPQTQSAISAQADDSGDE